MSAPVARDSSVNHGEYMRGVFSPPDAWKDPDFRLPWSAMNQRNCDSAAEAGWSRQNGHLPMEEDYPWGDEERAHMTSLKWQFYKTKLCPWHARNSCFKGDACHFAHGEDDLRLSPNLQKTRMCIHFMKDKYCRDGHRCNFAHGLQELRATANLWKTKLCPLELRSKCLAGKNCRYAHSKEELRPYYRSSGKSWDPDSPPTGSGCHTARSMSRTYGSRGLSHCRDDHLGGGGERFLPPPAACGGSSGGQHESMPDCKDVSYSPSTCCRRTGGRCGMVGSFSPGSTPSTIMPVNGSMSSLSSWDDSECDGFGTSPMATPKSYTMTPSFSPAFPTTPTPITTMMAATSGAPSEMVTAPAAEPALASPHMIPTTATTASAPTTTAITAPIPGNDHSVSSPGCLLMTAPSTTSSPQPFICPPASSPAFTTAANASLPLPAFHCFTAFPANTTAAAPNSSSSPSAVHSSPTTTWIALTPTSPAAPPTASPKPVNGCFVLPPPAFAAFPHLSPQPLLAPATDPQNPYSALQHQPQPPWTFAIPTQAAAAAASATAAGGVGAYIIPPPAQTVFTDAPPLWHSPTSVYPIPSPFSFESQLSSDLIQHCESNNTDDASGGTTPVNTITSSSPYTATPFLTPLATSAVGSPHGEQLQPDGYDARSYSQTEWHSAADGQVAVLATDVRAAAETEIGGADGDDGGSTGSGCEEYLAQIDYETSEASAEGEGNEVASGSCSPTNAFGVILPSVSADALKAAMPLRYDD